MTDDNKTNEFKFSKLSLEDIRQMHEKFVDERNWSQYHQPRNILLAMIGEIGELAELFQWKSDSDCDDHLSKWNQKELNALGDELSDVMIYLIRLADRCRIDIS